MRATLPKRVAGRHTATNGGNSHGKVPADLKVCIFDVFGTVVDWRGSLIEDLPKLGKKYGLDTDWTSFADDWRGLYQPQMARVRKGELPWTRIDDLHKEAFEMLLNKRGLKHPGEEGAWEFTHLWHKLRPWPDSVEGIGMMKKKYVVATLSNGNVALLINMAKHSGIPWDHCFSGETFHHYKPDPESYLGVVDSMYLKPHQVMLVAAHNGDLDGGAEMRPVDRLRPPAQGARPQPEDATSRPTATGMPSATRSSRWRRRSGVEGEERDLAALGTTVSATAAPGCHPGAARDATAKTPIVVRSWNQCWAWTYDLILGESACGLVSCTDPDQHGVVDHLLVHLGHQRILLGGIERGQRPR